MIHKIFASFLKSLRPSLKTILWLLKLMIPVSFVVMLLDYSGFLLWIAGYTAPFVKLIGLRGESALVLITSAFLNIYSAIAVIQSIGFSAREITILALMCLIAHNLIVETAVQKKTGSSALQMVLLRIGVSILGGFLLNVLLPASSAGVNTLSVPHADVPFSDMLQHWSVNTFWLIGKVILIITALNFLQKVLDDFSITLYLSKFMSPLLRLFGLPIQSAFMWLIANIIGLAWGSAVLIEQTEEGKISRKEADVLNHHIAISHSLLEDTLLFVAIGVAASWIIFPRLALAFVVVWTYRLFFLKNKS